MLLQRITSTGKWFPEIDGLRFIAIFAVLLVHVMNQMLFHGADIQVPANSPLHNVENLNRGVQLFFVISGFILAQPFIKSAIDGGKPVSLAAFYLRRVTRLEPPYLLSLAIYAVAMVTFRHTSVALTGQSLLSSIFYVHNFFPHLPALNFVTWSLEIEIVFYLLAPLLAVVFHIGSAWKRRLLLAGLIILCASLNYQRFNSVGFFFPAQLCFFLTGYLLADLRVHQRPLLMHRLWDLLSAACLLALFLIPERLPAPVLSNALCAVLFLGFAASMLGPWSRRFLSFKWVALFGGMCYSIYLMHMLIISALFPLTRRLHPFAGFYANYATQLLLLLPLVFAVSTLYFVSIERPCMDPQWPRKFMATFRKSNVPTKIHRPSAETS